MGRSSALIALALVGCDAPALSPDANAGDAGVDTTVTPDPDFAFSATYLDWDSNDASPCPIVGATWTATYDASRTATTDDAGAFAIKLPAYLSELQAEEPMMASPCATSPGTYELRATAVFEHLLHEANARIVMRSLTAARVATFYSSIGAPFDAARGQLYVHVDGPARAVSISSAHDATQAFDGTSWSAGDTGDDVYFPNIALADPAVTVVTVDGGAIGTGSVILPPGAITYVTVVTR